MAAALVSALAAAAAGAAESPSYTAYAQGRSLTALKLAEEEAAKGSKEAYTLMGEIYSEGLGVAQDFNKAADAYAKAADLGDSNAQLSLGLMVAEGVGVKKDPRIAADLFEKAAQSGNPAA
jgi:TPR repeat protein